MVTHTSILAWEIAWTEEPGGLQSVGSQKIRRDLAHVHVMLSRFSRVQLHAALWTVALQAPLSMGFSRQEYWCGLPFPSPGDLPNPEIEPGSPALEADALTSEPFICRY